MRYKGRNIDAVKLWDRYVDLPVNIDTTDVFLPKVQCPNPDHDTLKRHFQINVSQPTVHCFAGCGISGSYEHAICVIEGLYVKFKVEEAKDERERRRRVQRARRQAGKIILGYVLAPGSRVRGAVARKREPVAIVRPTDALEYARFLPAAARDFVGSRGITAESIAKWRLGFDPAELRIVIPAYDERDVLRFLIKRSIREKDQPKYLYTEGFPKNSLLFGACAISPGMIRSSGIVLVEGSFDAIVLQQFGIPAVAILGTGISNKQVEILSRMRPRRVYFMFDKDTAGVTNIEIAARKLRRYPCFVCRYPRGRSDPAEMKREEAVRSVERAVPASRWISQHLPNATRRERTHVG